MERREFLQYVIGQACEWVQSQRDTHRPEARALTRTEKSELGRFFENATLERVKVKTAPTIEEPPFYSVLCEHLKADPFNFRRTAGIAFVDTVVVSKSQLMFRSHLLPLLFHELVHVVQYEILGLRPMMERYVNGWAENGFQYHTIPLERDAFILQEQYEANPEIAFSVPSEIRRRLELRDRIES